MRAGEVTLHLAPGTFGGTLRRCCFRSCPSGTGGIAGVAVGVGEAVGVGLLVGVDVGAVESG